MTTMTSSEHHFCWWGCSCCIRLRTQEAIGSATSVKPQAEANTRERSSVYSKELVRLEMLAWPICGFTTTVI